MASTTPASKSQIRAAALLNISIDARDYTSAGAALEAAGVRADGIPAGQTWRSAAKLADADLLAALGASEATSHASESLSARNEHNAYVASTTGMQRRIARGERELRAAGYYQDSRDEEQRDFESLPAAAWKR